MSPLFVTLLALIAATAWLVAQIAILRINKKSRYVSACVMSIMVSITAFGSMFAWWLHPLRDTRIGAGEGFLVITIGIVSALIALRLRKVITMKYGFDPVPR